MFIKKSGSYKEILKTFRSDEEIFNTFYK